MVSVSLSWERVVCVVNMTWVTVCGVWGVCGSEGARVAEKTGSKQAQGSVGVIGPSSDEGSEDLPSVPTSSQEVYEDPAVALQSVSLPAPNSRELPGPVNAHSEPKVETDGET